MFHLLPPRRRTLRALAGARLWLLAGLVALTGCDGAPTTGVPSPTAHDDHEHAGHVVAATITVVEVAAADTPAASSLPDPALAAAPSLPPALDAAAPRINVAGSGEGHSAPLDLAPGLALFELTHLPATPIAIFLLNDKGEHLALLANATSLRSRQVAGIPAAGRYTLHVMATDAWSAAVSQLPAETLAQAAAAPHALAGDGAEISPPLALAAGQLRLEWSHAGTLPATIALWSADGTTRVEVLTNATETGGTATAAVPAAGTYLLDVLADGPWRVTFAP